MAGNIHAARRPYYEGRLVVDLGMVPDGDVPKEGSLFQYIGECAVPLLQAGGGDGEHDMGSGGGGKNPPPPPSLIVRARVARNVDGEATSHLFYGVGGKGGGWKGDFQ